MKNKPWGNGDMTGKMWVIFLGWLGVEDLLMSNLYDMIYGS